MIGSRAEWFEVQEQRGEALTYDDVVVRPGPGGCSAAEVDLSSHFSRNVELKTPLVSSPMINVTEANMAIAMAQSGGLGIIHAAMSPEDQKQQLHRVKYFQQKRVDNPRFVRDTDTVEEVLSRCAEKGYPFRSFPVVDNEGGVVGMLTGDDIGYQLDVSVRVDEAMTSGDRLITATADTTIEQADELMRHHKVSKLPLIDEETGELVGMYVYKDVNRILRGSSEFNVDGKGRLAVGAAVTTRGNTVEWVDEIKDYVDVIVIDTAHGDSQYAIDTARDIKQTFPGLDVVGGSISNPDSIPLYIAADVDGLRIGQGSGSICTTRVVTGAGMAQLTAVIRCVQRIKEIGVDLPVCADGGVNMFGDLTKALVAGASSVMVGRMVAGTEETPGHKITVRGEEFKQYNGMGSLTSMDHAAGRDRYGVIAGEPRLAQGVEARVPYKGFVGPNVLGPAALAVRQGLEYAGARSVADIQSEAGDRFMFDRVTAAGLRESHPHDVVRTDG